MEAFDRSRNRAESVPEYWWHEAEDMWSDAKGAIAAGLSRKTCCNLLHATIERALKALIAERRPLTDEDRGHGLMRLAKKAGVYDGLSPKFRQYLVFCSNLHSTATYPRGDAESQLWYDDGAYKALIVTTGQFYAYLRERSATIGDGSER